MGRSGVQRGRDKQDTGDGMDRWDHKLRDVAEQRSD